MFFHFPDVAVYQVQVNVGSLFLVCLYFLSDDFLCASNRLVLARDFGEVARLGHMIFQRCHGTRPGAPVLGFLAFDWNPFYFFMT